MTLFELGSPLSDLINSLHTDPQIRGKQFERITAWWLRNTPVNPFAPLTMRKVWLWDEWPDRSGPDIGIDLVIRLSDDSFCAVQAKCFDEARDIPKSEIDSFISAANPHVFQHKLLVATTDGLSANARRTLQEQRVIRVMRTDLERSLQIWPKTIEELNQPVRQPKAAPRPHQIEAINNTIQGFTTNDRGQLIMACGTGKTLTSLWILEHLRPQISMVLVPSLSLLSQTIYEWTQNTTQPWSYICVCSDRTVNRRDDEPISTIDEIPFEVTTDPKLIEQFLISPGQKVIFCTYQSSEQVALALDRQGIALDLVISDEAHRLAGTRDKVSSIVLDDQHVRVNKRLFMTATPRVYSAALKSRAEGRGVEVTSMDDSTVFGPVFHRLSFGDAIQSGLLSDYRVVVVGVKDEEVRKVVNDREIVSIDGEVSLDAATLAAHIGLAKATKKCDLRRVISFHGRIATAAAFSKVHRQVVDWMPKDEQPDGDLWTGTISGEMNAGVRRRTLEQLALSTPGRRALLTNARCLTEGIDVPAIDGVAFIDPRSSQVDIIQAVGRAIRRSEDKKMGTIFLSVLIPTGWEHDEGIEASPFRHVWEVVNALKAHDEELAIELTDLRIRLGALGSINTLPEKIVLDLPIDVEQIAPDFVEALQTVIIERTTDSWESWFGKLRAFSESAGHSSPKKRGVDYDLARLGNWVIAQRRNRKQGLLGLERQRRLESLPNWHWHLKADEIGIETKYKAILGLSDELGGLPTIKNRSRLDWHGHPIPQYVATIRTHFRLGKLEDEWIQKFQAIPGWDWRKANELSWIDAFSILEQYVEREGHANVPQSHKEQGFHLGNWVANQRNLNRRETLSVDRKCKLESMPGWTWNKIDSSFESTVVALRSFFEREGHYRVPHNHVENGIKLGRAIRSLRRSYLTKPELWTPDRKELVESMPSWEWRPSESQFEKNYEAILAFLRREGHIFPPKAHMENGVHLYGLMTRLRTSYQRGKLSQEQITAMESLPHWNWDYQDSSKRPQSGRPPKEKKPSSFDERIAIFREHIAEKPGTLPSLTHKSSENHPVGAWAGEWRRQWREGTLTEREIATLEAIPGWKWDPFNDAWETNFQLLLEYSKQHGHVNIPLAAKFQGVNLGSWIGAQRRKRKPIDEASSLDLERQTRLESLPGWTWNPKPGRPPSNFDGRS